MKWIKIFNSDEQALINLNNIITMEIEEYSDKTAQIVFYTDTSIYGIKTKTKSDAEMLFMKVEVFIKDPKETILHLH